MSKQRMSLLDATFLRIEKRESPMHVATLQVFRIPPDAPATFVRDVVAALREPAPMVGAFGMRLAPGPLKRVAPAMVPADVDLEYHVRHAALPAPGGERELGELVSHLHGVVLDRSRPLWTCHVIEGLAGNRFAIYLKAHHALTDGVGGMRLVDRALAAGPDEAWRAPWSSEPRDRRAVRSVPDSPPRPRALDRLATARSLAAGVRGVLLPGEEGRVMLPFGGPRSALNGPITGARRVATQQLELARLRAVAERTQTSINDVFLAICSGALRRHLDENGLLPDEPLVAGVPVSLRESGEVAGNAVGTVWSTLATDLESPGERLRAIHLSMVSSKRHLNRMSLPARKLYTLATVAPVVAVTMGGLGATVRPPMNVTISNVPGPAEARFLRGARLEAIYPVSIPVTGQALNITCVTYDGMFNIGFTGCRDSLPHLQRIAVYAGEALADLEALATV